MGRRSVGAGLVNLSGRLSVPIAVMIPRKTSVTSWRRGLRFAALGLLPLAVASCASRPLPSAAPSAVGARPAVRIDTSWTTVGDQWTFTGQVDPDGDPTDVVLEVGPGPATARRFDAELPVADDLIAAGPLTFTTRDIPDIDEICVRFTATNAAGTASSSPLCFPHDPPSIAPPGPPTVTIDERWTVAEGRLTFKGRVDPRGDPTDVVLELGPGPMTLERFDIEVAAGQDLTEVATLEITPPRLPDSKEVCVRFTATNSLGTATSTPLCVPRDGSASAPGASP
jgi:hypothetical protein